MHVINIPIMVTSILNEDKYVLGSSWLGNENPSLFPELLGTKQI